MAECRNLPYPVNESGNVNLQAPSLGSVVFVALASVSCAHAPAFPARSAAAPEATPAPLWSGGRALVEDPPLPGGRGEGWAGLGSAPSRDPHAGHRMGHGGGRMVMPDGTVMEMSEMAEPPDDAGTAGPDADAPDAGTGEGMEGMHHGR